MAETIKLYSSEELKAQGLQMTALKAEYEALFAQVTNALNSINDAWSPNMANNFSAKISNAQKAFSSISGMLERGASAAQMAANLLGEQSNPGKMLDLISTTEDISSIVRESGASGSSGSSGSTTIGGINPRSIGTADLPKMASEALSNLFGGGGGPKI